MNVMLKKEMRLSALTLTYLFIGFGAMTMLPGYPISVVCSLLHWGSIRAFRAPERRMISSILRCSRWQNAMS